MRKLLWKELYEQRFIPIVYGALIAAIIASYYGFSVWAAHIDKLQSEIVTSSETGSILFVIVLALGLFPGTSAISPEMAKGTIGFLTLLPGTRPRLWRAKIAAGGLTTLLSLVSVLLFYALTVWIIFGWAAIKSQVHEGVTSGGNTLNAFLMILVFAEGMLYVYAIALFFSTIIDRVITAAVLSIVGGIGLMVVATLLISVLSIVTPGMTPGVTSGIWDSPYLTLAMISFVNLALLSSSYLAFCGRDSLRSSRHVKIAVGSLLTWLIIGSVGLVSYGRIAIERFLESEEYSQVQPAYSWTMPANYSSYFTLPVQSRWSTAPIQSMPLYNTPFIVGSADIRQNPKDLQLLQQYPEVLNGSTTYKGHPPVQVKDQLEQILKAYPHWHVAEYRLAGWYKENGQDDQYKKWRDQSLSDAPHILAGRVQQDNGNPVIGADFQLVFRQYGTQSIHEPVSDKIGLTYNHVITDQNGCYYLPMSPGFFDMYEHVYSGGPESFMPRTTSAGAIQEVQVGRFTFTSRVSLMPPMTVRPFIDFTGAAAAGEASIDSPAKISTNNLEISWKPYPKADRYDAQILELVKQTALSTPGVSERAYPIFWHNGRSYDLKQTNFSMPLSGTDPVLNRNHVYLIRIFARQASTPAINIETYAQTRNYYFTPVNGVAPLPATKQGIEEAIPGARVQSIVQTGATTTVNGYATVYNVENLNLIERQVFTKPLLQAKSPPYEGLNHNTFQLVF